MITETTRDNALIAAANGKTAFVITQKGGYPDVVNLTKLLGEALTEKDNIFIADIEQPPLKVKEPAEKKQKLEKVKGRAEYVRSSSGGRKSTLDDGKILALYNAGWGYSKIAAEMDVDPSTIQYHLRKMKDKGMLT